LGLQRKEAQLHLLPFPLPEGGDNKEGKERKKKGGKAQVDISPEKKNQKLI